MTRFTAGQLMHGHDYAGQECKGWVAQRKWNGVFAGWDGERLFSREGNTIHAPEFFTAGLPDFPLCCELLAEKEGANFANGLIKQQGNPERWRNAKLMVFDTPRTPERSPNLGLDAPTAWGLVARVTQARHMARECPFATGVPAWAIRDRAGLRKLLLEMLSLNGEGLMIQPPDHPYTAGRTRRLLKVKRPSLHFLRHA